MFRIFVDSIANLTEGMINSYDIDVIPYMINMNGRDVYAYKKGKNNEIIARKFYAEMEAGAQPKTSLITTRRIIAAIRPYMEKGSDIVLITCSSHISGTYMQALEAANAMKNFCPDNKLYVVDSLNASLGEGFLAIKAAIMRDAGQKAKETADELESERFKIHSVFTCQDLKYLRRSGRISATSAIAGTILNVKPILYADNHGKISLLCNTHTRRKSISRIADEFSLRTINPGSQLVAICHANCDEDAKKLSVLLDARGAKNTIVQMYDICSGSHLGPGALALFFTGKDKRNL